jgi:hypothetical protein
MEPGSGLIGVGNPTLRIAGVLNTAITVSDYCLIHGLTIDADKASKPYHYAYTFGVNGDRNTFSNLTIAQPLSEAFRIYGDYNTLRGLEIYEGDRSAIFLRGGTGNVLEDILFRDMKHFGVHAAEGANRGILHNLRCYSNGLELSALLEDTWGFRVSACHAEGTKDNGLSIGGWGHVVEGNQTRKNFHNGICLFGRDITCTGNRTESNNQRRLTEAWPTFAGLAITPAFGSLGLRNTVVGNWSGDQQGMPTQWAGILAKRNSHVAWAPDAAVNGANPYRHHGGRVYKATGIGTSGTEAPTHTSGVAFDGALSWAYVAGNGTHLDAADNMVLGNVAYRNTVHPFKNDSPRAQAVGGQL